MALRKNILPFWLFLLCFLATGKYFSYPAIAATCNEACSTSADCDSTCPICIGTCVSCYELGDPTNCLSAATGGSTNCQWDGQNCKSITDVPSMPAGVWYWLLLPIGLMVGLVIRNRKS